MKYFVYAIPILLSATISPAKTYWNEGRTEQVKKLEKNADVAFLQKMDQAFSVLANQLSPTVVNIYTTTKLQKPNRNRRQQRDQFNNDPRSDLFEFFFGHPGRQFMPPEHSSLGSGFVINAEKGYIITNAHVVRQRGQNATEVRVKFIGEERQDGYVARIIGADERYDVALLQLKEPKKGLKAVTLGNSDETKVGQWVLAIGNPFGHSNSVTQGIVSAVQRDVSSQISLAELIQTSASINPGNSGGPLFNVKGEVIGINTAIDARAQGIGFSVPINTAKNIVKQLIENGEIKRGWLGIAIADVDTDIADQLNLPVKNTGVLVQDVEQGQPADVAGLKVYDVIHKLNGKEMASARKLSNSIAELPPKSKVKLEIFRDGKKRNLTAVLGRRGGEQTVSQNSPSGGLSEDLQDKAGIALASISEEIRRQLRLEDDIHGAYIRSVSPYSPGAKAGLQRGDIILEVNRKPVARLDTVEKAIVDAAKKKKSILLRVLKPNGYRSVAVLDLKS